ncbi:MAG: pyridoxal phosphate-dependent aminotransferase [Euryarchaeota archaeon]|nr:pyridoxal phosphate-dependent aminotransferase [Euryarchaeota archaeon]
MRFAKRLSAIDISGIRKMFELAKARDVVNLALGEPDFGIPRSAKQAIISALEEDFTHYTPNKGIPELRAAIAEKLRRENGINADEEDIIVTSGASEALHLAILALVEPGDEVLVPSPGFVSYSPLVRLAGGTPVEYPLRESNAFEPRVGDLEERLTERTRLIVVNSPSNPTGAVFSKRTVREIARLAESRGIPLLSDEVYERIIYEGEHHSFARYYAETITVNGFSKSYAMTGLRLGYVHAPGEAIEEMLKIHQYIQASTVSLSQVAALAALERGEEHVREMVERFRQRREIIMEELGSIPGVSCVLPRGAFYAFPNFSSYGSSGELAMALLKHAKVVVTPGTAFGREGEGYLRISFATGEESIREGMRRIRGYLEGG